MSVMEMSGNTEEQELRAMMRKRFLQSLMYAIGK